MSRTTAWLALLLIACAPSTPERVAGEDLGSMSEPTYTQVWKLNTRLASFVGAGDTLDYTLLCTQPNNRVTGFRWNTTVTGTGWTGMLVNATTGLPCSIPFRPINVSGWTTATFTACVRGTRGTDSTSTAGCATWTVVRGLGPMQPPGVDSSRVQLAVLVYPNPALISVGTSRKFCNYWQALDGMIRMQQGEEGIPECQGYYDLLPDHLRPPGYTTALEFKPNGQRWADDITVAHGVLPLDPKYDLARMVFASR